MKNEILERLDTLCNLVGELNRNLVAAAVPESERAERNPKRESTQPSAFQIDIRAIEEITAAVRDFNSGLDQRPQTEIALDSARRRAEASRALVAGDDAEKLGEAEGFFKKIADRFAGKGSTEPPGPRPKVKPLSEVAIEFRPNFFGVVLRQVRLSYGFTLRKMAETLGLTSSLLSDIERGSWSPLSNEQVLELADEMVLAEAERDLLLMACNFRESDDYYREVRSRRSAVLGSSAFGFQEYAPDD